jgi:hypothetical protein
MKKLFLVLIHLYCINIVAQGDNSILIIKVTGTGQTPEESINNGLRSAIQQSFSSYIMSKNEILDKNLISDEFISTSSGNIQKYTVISQFEIPNVGFFTNINVEISVPKLSSFAQSKGFKVEIKGGLFAAKIKQQILNETSEINLISNTFGLIHELMQKSFDFNIQVKEPQSNSSDSQNWKIPITIESISNDNINNVYNLLISSLENISLSKNEFEDYKNLGKEIFTIRIRRNKEIKEYYLRKAESLEILKNIELNWFFYTSNFVIDNNYEKIFLKNRFYYYYDDYPYYKYQFGSKAISEGANIVNLSDEDVFLRYPKMYNIFFDNNERLTREYLEHNLNLDIVNSNIKCSTIDFYDFKSLELLEKINEYKISGSGVVSQFKFGGYLVDETSEKYTIVAPFNLIHDNRNLKSDIGNKTPDYICNWFIGISSCDNFNLSQLNDWKAPELIDLKNLTNNLFLKGIGCNLSIPSTTFWSIEEKDSLNSYVFSFNRDVVLQSKTREENLNSDRYIYEDKNKFYNFVRPVRYEYKNSFLEKTPKEIKKNNSIKLENENILIFKGYEESDLVYFIFEDLNGKGYDFSAMPQPEKYELIDNNYNINPKFLNKKFKIKWKAIPGTSEEYGYPYNEIISIELID